GASTPKEVRSVDAPTLVGPFAGRRGFFRVRPISNPEADLMTSANARQNPVPAPPPGRRPKPTPPSGAPVKMTGAQAVVRSLEEVDREIVFGIPGGTLLPSYVPLLHSQKARHILVRHEQGAGHAAVGYAQATGRVGVCMATSGPGATNLVTALADAH